ncbi:MAG: NAD(P)/FAD-dependent oxidoreductase [Saprospiraceae bacterium]
MNAPTHQYGEAQEYDVVVIGSGLGGLACATILAHEGYNVCVLERNKQIGGALQTFVRDRVIFDSGVHYVGGLDPGQNLYQLFQFLGIMDKLRIKRMDAEVFDAIAFEGDPVTYKYAQGYEAFIVGLLENFPEEEMAIRAYCGKIRSICDHFPLYNLRMGDPAEKDPILAIDTATYLDSITQNIKLKNVLAATNMLYAGEADKTPLYVHALIINSYIESSYRFVDGGSQIAKYLAREITQSGGKVLKRIEVIRIVEADGKITHIETAAGHVFKAKTFICNMHPKQMLDLLHNDSLRPAYKHRINSLENSTSTFCLNIVMKPNSFAYLQHNYYYFKEEDVWGDRQYDEDSWPLSYAMYFPISRNTKTHAEGVSVMAYMNIAELSAWENTYNTVAHEGERGESYHAFKKRKAEKLIKLIEVRFPGFSNCIQSYSVFTPLTIRDYIGSDDGSLYGIMQDYKDPIKTFVSAKTKIPNLLLTGQNLNLHGILGVTMSAIVTCAEILGMEYLLGKIHESQ